MNGKRILIVEDEANIRDTMQMALEAEGCVVETSADGPAGLRWFADPEERWDLVLLDQRMPGMEGIEVLHRMREMNPKVPVILVTAYGTMDLAGDVLRSGAMGFLRKPFTPAGLRDVVRDVLGGRAPAGG